MNVLVDTTIWSLALRRQRPTGSEVDALKQVVLEGRARIIGPIRQEVLSGVQTASQQSALKLRLRAFDDLPLSTHHFESAADLYNQCRRRGVQGSHIDFLICAVAKHERLAIFTTDRDFARYSEVIGLSLYEA